MRPLPPAHLRRLTGAAALGYVIAAAVENMELLSAPALGASAAEVRAAYADQALATVTTVAGAIALACYACFAAGLLALARPRGLGRAAALVGAAGGPLLAAIGLALTVPLVAGSASDDAASGLFDAMLALRLAAGPLMGLFLLAVTARCWTPLPAPLTTMARVVAVPLAFTPLAASTGELFVAASAAFGAHALWIWLAGLWLALGARDIVRRAAFLMLVLAAGGVGLALLAVPGATGSFFAWELEPAPLAAFAGGVYVASAAVYAVGLRHERPRALVAAAVVLSVSVLVISLTHLGVFDFARLQAWAWMALFGAFAAVMCAHARRPLREGAPLGSWARWTLAGLAALLGAAGICLWADPAWASQASPFALPPMGGRFAGSWIVMLAVLAGWAAWVGRREEAVLPALALIALPLGALAAALRTFGELAGAEVYVAALLVIAASGGAVLTSAARHGRRDLADRDFLPPRLQHGGVMV